jgi:hypothetical protein
MIFTKTPVKSQIAPNALVKAISNNNFNARSNIQNPLTNTWMAPVTSIQTGQVNTPLLGSNNVQKTISAAPSVVNKNSPYISAPIASPIVTVSKSPTSTAPTQKTITATPKNINKNSPYFKKKK